MQIFQSVSRPNRRAKHSSLQLTANSIASIRCRTDLKITNHRGHKFPPSLTLLSFKTRIKWPSVLTTTTSFSSVFFQLQEHSRYYPSFSAHRAALMTKTALNFPAFSLTFVDFAVQLYFRAVSFNLMRSH